MKTIGEVCKDLQINYANLIQGKTTKESNKKKKTKTKKKIRRLKGSDYYELDGDFFD